MTSPQQHINARAMRRQLAALILYYLLVTFLAAGTAIGCTVIVWQVWMGL